MLESGDGPHLSWQQEWAHLSSFFFFLVAVARSCAACWSRKCGFLWRAHCQFCPIPVLWEGGEKAGRGAGSWSGPGSQVATLGDENLEHQDAECLLGKLLGRKL